MDGVARCSRYAFGPNRLHYCGPDANREVLDYLRAGASDIGLETLLSRFHTLYPYLKLIARANRIRDPFDDRVVEAYWLGNRLLDNVTRSELWRNLIDDHKFQKRLSPKTRDALKSKIAQGPLPHHSWHVFNFWHRTGHTGESHTIETLDACRTGWGKVLRIAGPRITIEYEPLVLNAGRLALGVPAKRTIMRQLEAPFEIDELRAGDTMTFHWWVPCEKINARQVKTLRKYTLQSIALANQTL